MNHDNCMMTNQVIIVAGSEQEASDYAHTRLPIGMARAEVGSAFGYVRALCPEHVMYLTVGSWLESPDALRLLALLKELGFKRGRNPLRAAKTMESPYAELLPHKAVENLVTKLAARIDDDGVMPEALVGEDPTVLWNLSEVFRFYGRLEASKFTNDRAADFSG